MLVEGAIVDRDGARPGYVRFKGGRVVETGKLGTASRGGSERRVRGIIVPPSVTGDTHLGDAVSTREPPHQTLAQIVGSPSGYKFQLLSRTPPSEKRAAMHRALAHLAGDGTAVVIDFREEGTGGVELLRSAARQTGVKVIALGRPLKRPVDPRELREVLAVADGIGLSSAREEPQGPRSQMARAARRESKWYALHASESVREPVDDYLNPRPDLLVHLTCATEDDLKAVVDAKVAVAVCPRSNALFGRRPDLARLEKVGALTLIGTDNAMFHAPTMFRELEFAYVSARMAGHPVSPEFLGRCAFTEPWRFLGEPTMAWIDVDSPCRPVVLRLPPDDPWYQLVTRATEQLIIRPGSARRAGVR
ncbi:MAG: amidohydrolase family protein [Thermoplasmata archaeon]|nr:amidohydrolase family protein [Thermoplasmata archaeon]